MKPSFEVSPDVRKLVDFLLQRDRASYNEMNRVIGRFVNGRDRHVLNGAKNILQRDHMVVFVVERGVGVQRATNSQVATLSTDHVISKTGRIIRRSKKLHPLVNTQTLTGEERDAYFIGKAVTQAMYASMGRNAKKQIAQEVKDQGEEIDVTDVVALFSRPRKKPGDTT